MFNDSSSEMYNVNVLIWQHDLCLSVFMLGSFSSVSDLLIALEGDGRIKGWAEFYLALGEPYLVTPHGIAICYWDFFGHYFLYIGMLYFICKG